MDHVFLRGMHHQKVDGRSPPTAPTSIAAASGWTAGISRRERGRFVYTIRDTLQCWDTRRGWAAGDINFIIGIAISVTTRNSAKAHVPCFFTGHTPPKS